MPINTQEKTIIERAKKIVTEASEQSNRISVPEILKIQNLESFLKSFPENGKLIFCDINCDSSNLKNVLSKKMDNLYRVF